MKPCLIVRKPDQSFSAWNEDGRWLATACSYSALVDVLTKAGYEQVLLNSRLGRTIMDKITGNFV